MVSGTFSTFSALSCSVSSATRSSLSWSLLFCRSRYRFCAVRFFSLNLYVHITGGHVQGLVRIKPSVGNVHSHHN